MTVKKIVITQERLKELFNYDGRDLIWRAKVSPMSHINIGDVAGCVEAKGYRSIGVGNKSYKAHRLIWFWHHGKDPTDQIDHINQDKLDNRIENLREASNQENCKNRKINPRNTSGITGVSWHKWHEKWAACVKVSGKLIHIGYFETFDLAVSARKAAETKYGFHENHGRPVVPTPKICV